MARHLMEIAAHAGPRLEVSFSTIGKPGEMTIRGAGSTSIAGPVEVVELRDFLSEMIHKHKIHDVVEGEEVAS